MKHEVSFYRLCRGKEELCELSLRLWYLIKTSSAAPSAYPVIFEGRAAVELYLKLKGMLLKIVYNGSGPESGLPDCSGNFPQLRLFVFFLLRVGPPDGVDIPLIPSTTGLFLYPFRDFPVTFRVKREG